MLSEKERHLLDELSKLLQDIMMLSHPPEIPAHFASIESVQILCKNLLSLREFLFAASNGDLSKKIPYKGFVAGTLKTLQANLRHLTWQTKMVASGDFTQRIEFMGEFSKSFNAMVIQFDETLKELVKKETELSRTNEELLKEIGIRKQTEEALRKSEKALRFQATTDSLTGLFNRRHFYKLADIEISKIFRYLRPMSLMLYDIDFFKRVNDTFGHPAGDEVIKKIAEITKKELRRTDIAARYGGEEFIVLLPETSLEEAAGIAERVRRQIETTVIDTLGRTISVTASFGVTDYRGIMREKSHEMVLSESIANADQALYTAKNSGRNMVTVYEPELESSK